MSGTVSTPTQHDELHRDRSAILPSSTRREDAALARLLGQPIRLGILRALLERPQLSFVELREIIPTTDGNLSMHARKLEDALLVSCTKGFRGRFPRTEYQLTADGRAAVERFLAGQ
jgi:DNA-binding transcriptional ArsR family regulator